MKDMLRIGFVCLFALSVISCGGGSGTPPPPPPPMVTVTPSSATVGLGSTQQFSASSSAGTSTMATWSVNGAQGGNSTVGTIDSSGKYTAPTSFPSPNALTVSASIGGVSGTASLTVDYPNDNHLAQNPQIKMGTSGGNATDFVDTTNPTPTRTCCSGTLGSIVLQGGVPFVLSNNHVLFKSDAGSNTDTIQQPGLVDNTCDLPQMQGAPPPTFNTVSNSIQAAPLKPTSNSPSTPGCSTPPVAPLCGPAANDIDAAIAQADPNVDTSGVILDLGAASPTSIAAAPPSSNVVVTPTAGQGVAKSGRSTGLTCSTIQAVATSVFVDYAQACGGATSFRAIFSNEIMISGGSFSAFGDSGSLIVTSDTARPIGLLFAGNTTSTTANPIQEVMNVLGFSFPLGNSDHPVSCQPTATAHSASTTVGASSAKLSVEETARVNAVKDKFAAQIWKNEMVTDLAVGSSLDSPGEGALVITVQQPTNIPAVIGGVRTRVVFANVPAPAAHVDSNVARTLLSKARAQQLMQQSGIQGVGIGVSDDNPAEPAMVIYVISGVPHDAIPPVIDGLRTKIIEGDRFRAFGWGKETMKPACSLKSHSQQNTNKLGTKLP